MCFRSFRASFRSTLIAVPVLRDRIRRSRPHTTIGRDLRHAARGIDGVLTCGAGATSNYSSHQVTFPILGLV
jgi:hypothetical protein